MVEYGNCEVPKEARDALGILRDELAGKLVGVYLYGSAVAGGLQPNSDVDVLALVRERPDVGTRRRIVSRLMTVSGTPELDGTPRPLEVTVLCLSDLVPWRYPPRCELLYGEWLRETLEGGTIPPAALNPDLAIVLTKAIADNVVLFGPPVGSVVDPVPAKDVRKAIADSLPELIGGLEGDERNVLLTLARMWMTVETGEIVSKDNAAAWAVSRLPAGHRPLMEIARRAYLGECRDSWRGRESDVGALVGYMHGVIEQTLAQRAS
ncbi:O-nucleotidylltransferase [Ectothiorhodospira sp. PHS-1]|uniref:aminoglycoside nucleotidyltransferase ANT9 n=1 Tax=Ectothiorhodospira sp. PHS-1 TaxID=519989 RepID=UPI00024A822D|nr:aminoglycoside nucleotidyltransferase ANT9 [Ectothiorhodospira sp. PHS-1]EHQ51516.1 O-nucleotidylltransferase [Ectothiorhodospira sp. PHS-1]